MRITKDQAAENRQQIVEAAARLFREKGFDGVAVPELMKAAGFTHGGFYNHFASKEALAAEASASGIAHSNERLAKRLTPTTAKDDGAVEWRRYVERYLSGDHRDNPASGCTVAALAADAARQGKDVQESFAQGFRQALAIVAEHMAATAPDESESARRERAIRQWSEMVGALVLSRAVSEADPALSEELLKASRRRIS